jgi:hypothetical protein
MTPRERANNEHTNDKEKLAARLNRLLAEWALRNPPVGETTWTN